MSYPVQVSFQLAGGVALPDFLQLQLHQPALTHHSFALDLSVAALAKALQLAPGAVPTQAPARLIGQPVAISWHGTLPADAGRAFGFTGLITQLSLQTNADLVNYYQLSGYSPTYLLEDGVQHRTFVKQSLAAIVEQVLADYSANALPRQLQAAPGGGELAYTVQYGENNFYFLSRLAAEQGEWLYYDGQTLRLGRQQGKTLAFRSDGAQQFALSLALQPARTQGGAYNYRTHETLRTQAQGPVGGHPYSQLAGQKSQEVFAQPLRLPAGTYARDQQQLQRQLDGLAAQQSASQVSLTGSGEVFELTPGCLLNVQDAGGESYGQFRVLAVRHEIDGDGNYANHFEALPAAAMAPPPNPLYPAVAAQPELAEVVDLQDPRRLGRVRVRFQWPVKSAAAAESGWLRVSTPYSGDGKGQLFVPEVGSQVLVGYEHARAEFPVVLGNLFHEQNPQQAIYTRADNNLKGIQTAGGNKLVFNETAGEQSILLSNSNNKDTAVEVSFKGDGSITVKSKGPVTVLSPTITLEADNEGTIKMHAKTITMEAEDGIEATARTKSISLKAGENVDVVATEQMNVHAKEKTIVTSSKLQISGGSKIDIKAGIVKVNS